MITIGNITLDNSIPKICVPLTGRTIEELVLECQFVKELSYDILELRIDYYREVTDLSAVGNAIDAIRSELPNSPLLFTFRTKGEGGEIDISEAYYFELIDYAIHCGKIDAIDIEYFSTTNSVTKAINSAKTNEIPVILSSHDFAKTPPFEELINRLEGMKKLGGDVAKLACMPHTPKDVLTLLCATNTMHSRYPNEPIITMSMGGLGAISRICGETFGSCLTFGSAKKASAPGQIDVQDLRRILEILH